MSRQRPFTIGLLGVFFLIALRACIGWHFFQEGLSHKNNPKWGTESEGFFRQAKGPLADYFKGMVPGLHNRDKLIAVPLEDAGSEPGKNTPPESSKTYGAWYIAIVGDWDKWRERFETFYKLDDVQKQQLKESVAGYRQKLAKVLDGYDDDIAGYRHELWRNQQMAGGPRQGLDTLQIPWIEPEKKNQKAAAAEEIPNIKARLASRDRNPTGEPGVNVASTPAVWSGEVQALETAMQRDAMALRSDAQRALGQFSEVQSELAEVNQAVIWTLIIGGGCLLVGLFTRLSALVLALFLGSIIATQPAWIAGTVPTYFQWVEFVALLALASSHVGRWGGLDFFIHHLITRPLGWSRD